MNSKQPERYLVTWTIDSDARTPREAAEDALRVMRRPHSTAVVFEVRDREGRVTTVDLAEAGADLVPLT
jgi:hypothetical protein